ncbi:MAG: Na/Pi symporter [Victivallales bacterium]|nr:Na/Pi symporter [Victivallales bacterium]
MFPKRISQILCLGFALSFVLVGCRPSREHTPDHLVIREGVAPMAQPGAECEEPLVVEVLGALRKGALGGQGHRPPAEGVRVRVEAVTQGASAEPSEGETDGGGKFVCRLKLARRFGDQYFKISCPGFDNVNPVFVHAVAGVHVEGAMQETVAGDVLLHPIRISLKDEDGAPMTGVSVFFSLKSGPTEAKLTSTHVLTDGNGVASVGFRTAESYTGKYEILAEIGEDEKQTRAIVIPELGVSRQNIIIGVLGGLGIFLLGMSMMSDGLTQLAGNKLKSLLQAFTGSRWKAMLAGLVVTALIQSSGACTVMVVGFVNAGLLNLVQGLGIVLGSAIGTTVTAQMVSLQLDFLALPAIALGVIWLLLAKNNQNKGIANAILGFGLLFYGMTLMSSQLKSVAQFPTFISFFRTFDCRPAAGEWMPSFGSILGAILVGTVMTVVVQSSSATVGVAIALAESGLLNFYTAVPLILGDNIGSTITGLLASVNTSRPSRQTAFANTCFKVLAVLLMLPLFYVPWRGHPCFLELVDVITTGEVFAEMPENIGRHLASAHTLFNVCSVLLFLPMVRFLARVAKLVIPDRDDDAKDENVICHLEQRLLNTPSAALSQVFYALTAMTQASMDLTHFALEAMLEPDQSLSRDKVDQLENRIDRAQHDIIEYLAKLTRRHLNQSQSSAVPVFMHCVNDIERIGDRAVNIFDLVPTFKTKDDQFSIQARLDIRDVDAQLQKMRENLTHILQKNVPGDIPKVVRMETEIKRLIAKYEHDHETRLQNQECTVERGVVFVELLSNLERISAHLGNVAERANELLPHSVTFTT